MITAPSSPAPPLGPTLVSGDAPLLVLEQLTRRRGRADSRFELEVPSFRLESGRFIAVVGESGCGKSTLLDILALVLRPSACVTFRLAAAPGRPPEDLHRLWAEDREDALAALRRHVFGYVLQTGGLLPFLSVAENLRLPGRIAGRPVAEAEIRSLARRIRIDDVL